MLATARSLPVSSVSRRDTAAPQAADGAGIMVRARRDDAALATSDLTFDVATSRAGLDALETEWNALFDHAGRDIHVFQSFNWVWHWARHFLPPSPQPRAETALYILTARRAGRLVMVWPLVRERRVGLVHISFLGEPVSQYGDLLIDDMADREAVLDRALAYLVDHGGGDVIALRRVRADANLAGLMTRAGAIVTERRVAPQLDLASAPDFDTYEQRYSTKARRNRRRQMRRFEERGPTGTLSLEKGARAGELAALAISLKRAWVKDRGLYSTALGHRATRGFFAAVAAAEERPVGAVVTCLETRGEPAAIEIAFDCKGRRAVHVLVYALKFEQGSVGKLLIEQSLRNAFDKGLKVYDFLAPGDAYKLEWADRSTEVLDYALGTTAKGRAFARVYVARLRPRLKAAVNGATGMLRRLKRAGPKTSEKPAE